MRLLRSSGTLILTILTLTASSAYAAGDPALISQGKATYDLHCARCHGLQGKGDGMDAKRVSVPPRDLTEGVFKFQSTAQGTPPSDEDLMWTLNHGMSGAGMPSFSNLNNDVKKSLIAYLKTLSSIFETEPEPLTAPNPRAKVDLEKGKELYTKLQCALCHGAEGRANGTSAASLKDKWERPIKSANLTQGWTYRAGDSATQIYFRLMAGINGAPMPSYAEAVSAADAWQLSKYVEAMQHNSHWRGDVLAKSIAGELPVEGTSAEWASAQQTDVNLQSSFYQEGRRDATSINSASVQTLVNEQSLAFRLTWNDPTESRQGKPDAFLLALTPQTFKGKGTDTLHNLYYPGADELDLYYWNAQNPTVVRQVISSVEAATRPGARFSNELKASAAFHDGVWTLVFSRPKKLNGAESFESKEVSTRVGLAAWDGADGDAGLKRSASKWISLLFKENKSAVHH